MLEVKHCLNILHAPWNLACSELKIPNQEPQPEEHLESLCSEIESQIILYSAAELRIYRSQTYAECLITCQWISAQDDSLLSVLFLFFPHFQGKSSLHLQSCGELPTFKNRNMKI